MKEISTDDCNLKLQGGQLPYRPSGRNVLFKAYETDSKHATLQLLQDRRFA